MHGRRNHPTLDLRAEADPEGGVPQHAAYDIEGDKEDVGASDGRDRDVIAEQCDEDPFTTP